MVAVAWEADAAEADHAEVAAGVHVEAVDAT